MAGPKAPSAPLWPEERRAFAPPERLTVSEWAEHYRIVTTGPFNGQRWSNARTPFLREIMDSHNAREVQEITVMKGVQAGGTDLLLNVLGYVIDQDPDWCIYVMPRDDDWKHICTDRVRPMVEQSERLLEHVTNSASDLTKGALRFDRATVFFAAANSAAGLASKTCRIVMLDEVDKYPAWTGKETDPISLAKKRANNFANRKIWKISTPTTRHGAISNEWEKSDQRRYHIPCPWCRHYQHLVWGQVRFPTDMRDPDALREDPRVAYHCSSCDKPISDLQKRDAMQRGVWVPKGAEITQDGNVVGARRAAHRGYHVTGLLSPFRSWGQIAAEWVVQCKTAQGLMDFYNNTLGEPFEQKSETTDSQYLESLKQDYPSGTVPDAALWLTAGVDVQDRLLYYTIRAWGIGLDSWLVQAGRVDTWEALENVLFATRYQKGNGRDELVVRKMCIDTQGHRTSEVHAWCRKWDGIATPVKGAARLNGEPYRPFRVERTEDGKPVGGMAWHVDTSYFKDTLHRLIHTQPGDKGFWALHCQATQEYMAQVSAEHRIAVTNKRTKRIDMAWTTKPGGGENHWLDCYSVDTEVLTDRGWITFEQACRSDTYGTVNLKTREIEYQKATHFVRRRHDGDMVQVGGERRSRVSLLVTPGHRMVGFRTQRDADPFVFLAGEMRKSWRLMTGGKWVGESHPEGILLVATRGSPERRVDPADLAEFLGWYVSEGSKWSGMHHTQPSSLKSRVTIYQNPGPKRDLIRSLLRRMPWGWHEHSRGFSITNAQAFAVVENCGWTRTKRVPEWIKRATPQVISAFLRGAVSGDGWIDKRTGARRYATISKGLADDISELFIKSGSWASVHTRSAKPYCIRGRSGDNTRTQYWVMERTPDMIHLRDGAGRPNFKTVHYNGEIACATVPNGTLIVRRDGKIVVCGNCEVYALVAADMLGIHQVNAQDVASAGAKAGAGKSIRDHMPASRRAFGRPARRGFGP